MMCLITKMPVCTSDQSVKCHYLHQQQQMIFHLQYDANDNTLIINFKHTIQAELLTATCKPKLYIRMRDCLQVEIERNH